MTPLLLLPKLFLAGGAFLGTLQLPPDSLSDNHTLAGEKISSQQVVTRSHWGTPMLPDGKGGYSLIAPVNTNFIAQSLWIPPVYGTRPDAPVTNQTNATAAPTPALPLPVASPTPVTQ